MLPLAFSYRQHKIVVSFSKGTGVGAYLRGGTIEIVNAESTLYKSLEFDSASTRLKRHAQFRSRNLGLL